METIARTRSSKISVADESPVATRLQKRRQGKQAGGREPLVDVTNAALKTTRGRPPRAAVVANQGISGKGSGDGEVKDAGALSQEPEKSSGIVSASGKRGDLQVLSKPESLAGEKSSVTSSRTRGRTRSDILIATPKLEAPNYAKKANRINQMVTPTTGRIAWQESAGKRRASPGQKDCKPQKISPRRRRDGTQLKDERGKLGYESIARSVNRATKAVKTPAAKNSQQARLNPPCKQQEEKQAESIPRRNTVPKEKAGCCENLVVPPKKEEQLGDSQPQSTCVRRNGSRAAKKSINYAEDVDESIAKLSRTKLSTPCATAKRRDHQETRQKSNKPAGVLKASTTSGGVKGDNSRKEKLGETLQVELDSIGESVSSLKKSLQQKVSKRFNDANDDHLLTIQQHSVKNKIEKVHNKSCESSNASEDCGFTSGNSGSESQTIHESGELLRAFADCSSEKLQTQKACKKQSNDKKTAAKKIPPSLKK